MKKANEGGDLNANSQGNGSEQQNMYFGTLLSGTSMSNGMSVNNMIWQGVQNATGKDKVIAAFMNQQQEEQQEGGVKKI